MRVYAFGMNGADSRSLTELGVVGKCDGGLYKGSTAAVPIGKKYNVTWVVANVVLAEKGDRVATDNGSNLSDQRESLILTSDNSYSRTTHIDIDMHKHTYRKLTPAPTHTHPDALTSEHPFTQASEISHWMRSITALQIWIERQRCLASKYLLRGRIKCHSVLVYCICNYLVP